MPLSFSWDDRKARTNLRKHGVSFSEAATVFGDLLSLTMADPDHSADEMRFVTIGRSGSDRLLVVVHADDGENVRIVSARRATRREQREYEESD